MIRVNCEPATNSTGDERKNCQLHIRCLYFNQKKFVQTADLYNPCFLYKGFGPQNSAEKQYTLCYKIIDIIIKDYIQRHLFHDIVTQTKDEMIDEANPTYEGQRFNIGYTSFDKHILTNFRDINNEMTLVD